MKNYKNDSKSRRVVITGLGVISSLGVGWEDFWTNLIAGKTGISKITSFDTSQYDRHYAGEIKNFNAKKFMSLRKTRQMGRASQLAIAASKLAIKDAKLNFKGLSKLDMGVCIGTTMGEPQVMEKLDERCFPYGKWNTDFISALIYPASSISKNVAQTLMIHNQNLVFSNACSAGNYAIGYSFDLIRTGKADFMLAGGSDAFSRIAFTGFNRLIAMAPERCQPFDKNRKGMIIGEGAAILLLESFESARARKANIYAEIGGYGLSCDAHHMTSPSIEGVISTINKALRNASVSEEEINYISAHGTGTKENDRIECLALNRVFLKYSGRIPISSIKSMLGHTMGSASAFGAVACCLVINNNKIPPTINLEEQDPECDIDCVPDLGREISADIVLNNSQAFGGNNACLILKRI